eukprot:gene25007-31410_t
MDDLKRMAVFATVVQHGSMTGAARALGMSPSAVSQQVRQLEREGGVTLLHRSTRKLALTEAGQRYHAQCAAMCAAAEQARAELAASRDAPSGELRLSATVGFARHIAPALGGLLAQYPALRLRLLVDDAPIDLINARVDLAVRFGRLADSSWAARHSLAPVRLQAGGFKFEAKMAVNALEDGFEYKRLDTVRRLLALPLGLKNFLLGQQVLDPIEVRRVVLHLADARQGAHALVAQPQHRLPVGQQRVGGVAQQKRQFVERLRLPGLLAQIEKDQQGRIVQSRWWPA